jgi:tetratricopeptide (TPR) repeat protein
MPSFLTKLLELSLPLLPLRAELLNEVGVSAFNTGRMAIAEAFFSRAVKRDPAHGPAIYNLGRVFVAQGKFDRAIACFEKNLELGAMGVEPENDLGVIHLKRGNLEEARSHIQRVLSVVPAHANAQVNLGHVLAALGSHDEALARYASVLKAQPDHAEAHFGFAVQQLIMGRLRQGWKEYEWRFERSEGARLRLIPPSPAAQRWQGESLKGKRILLRAEQGLGDTIQFSRFAGRLQTMGASVYLSVQESLVELLRSLEGVSGVCAMGQEKQFEPYEYWSPLLSVARLLDVSLHNIPDKVPYLHAQEAAQQRWKMQLDAGDGKLRVGIVWRGNPDHENDRNRSLPLEQLDSLANPHCAFFSLQLGVSAQQMAKSALAPVSLAGQLRDFSETAAAVVNLDLVIAVDTSVAHLAGALGRPVWLLLPFNADWRWLLERNDTPWYPTMRLYRQPERGDWSSIFATLAQDLAKLSVDRHV